MTADDPDSVPQAAANADEERWLTYLNYDQSVKQAVRRLGALSSENVDLFRSLLMQSRDRSRIKEYEAESIRRLQGEVFVGDEELQRALIVLNAEDPGLAEEFRRVVATTGKPQGLDQAIAAIRAQKDAPAAPQAAKILKLVETPRTEAPPVEAPRDDVPSVKAPAVEAPRKAVPPMKAPAVETPRKDVPPVKAPAPMPRPVPITQPEKNQPGASRLAIAAVLLVAAVAGAIFLWPRLSSDDRPARIAAAPPAAAPQSAPPQAAPPQASSAQAASPSQTPQRAAAPAVEIAMPAQNDGKTGAGKKPDGKTSPEIRPASAEPDKIAPDSAPANALSTPAPVPGAYYKVVRGDMLTAIAVRAYRDASKFLIIQRANPSLRTSADLILVDQVIFIPKTP